MNEKQNKIFEMIQILKKVQEEKERSLKIKNENTSFKVEDVSNVVKEVGESYVNLTTFEYDGLTYIPVRSLSTEEKELVNNRTSKEIWKNSIIEKPKNGNDYSIEKFKEIGNSQNTDLFYCIERGKFFTPIERGIINLNEDSIDKHFRDELNRFYNNENVQKIIKSNRILQFNNEKDLNLLSNINSVLSEGEVFQQNNVTLGDVRIRLGNPQHNGLSHIIKRRMDKFIEHNGLNLEEAQKETAAILFLAVKNISEAPATKETNGRYAIFKNGIKTAIDTDKNGKFIVSGFDFDDTKTEAVDAIMSVNAHYGYAPEFLEIYAQVGATYASLTNNISQNEEKSNDTLEDKIKNRFEKSLKKISNLDINNENYKETLELLTKLEKLLNNTEVEKEKENDLNQNIENQEIEEKKDKKIIFGQTVLPPVAAFTKDGQLKNFDNLVIQSFDEKNKTYVVSNEEESLIFPEETVDSLLNPKVIHKVENDKEIAQVEGQGLGVVLNDDEKGIKGTEIPEFSIKTQDDEFRTYKGFVVSKYNPAEKSYTLKNGDESVTITESTFKEAISPERFKNQFDENTPAYKKLLKTQYESFFESRDNDACNFVHNFSVYCRKEANSPCDALKIAKMITQRMPKDEVQKTKNLINKMKYEDESLNEFLVRKYHEAVKAIPLNEDYIKYHQPENVITRPFYDTVTAKGQNIENDLELKRTNADYNLKIGGILKNVNLKQDKVFGIGKEAVHYDELTVVSASKEGNSITLMDKNKSFFELPRDTVLKAYKQQALAEIKQEQKHSRRNEIEFSYSM